MSARPGAPPRWVLDTNVVLSALVRPGGVSGRLRLAWQARHFTPVVSTATTAELIRVLGYPKFGLTPDQQHDLLADYLPWAHVVQISARPPDTPACRDPHDVAFLQLAYTTNADALVTGDADLLTLAPEVRMPVLTPAQAVDKLSA